MKYYILEIHEDYPSEDIFVETREYDCIDIDENDLIYLYNDERYVDPWIVLAREESIEIKYEGYDLREDDILDNLGYEPTISSTDNFSKERPDLVFDKFKDAFSADERFDNIRYHKVKVRPDMNLYRLVIPCFDKEDVFDLEKTLVQPVNRSSEEKYRALGYSEYQIKVEKEKFRFRKPVFKEENLAGIHAFKLRYDFGRIFVDEVFKEFCEQNGFNDIDFFDIEYYEHC